MYWNGSNWVDQYGSPAGNANPMAGRVPQSRGGRAPSGPMPMVPGMQPVQRTAGGAPPAQWWLDNDGVDVWNNNRGDQAWQKSKSAIDKMLFDYFMGGGYEDAMRNQASKQAAYDKMWQGLDMSSEAERMKREVMGSSMGDAEEAAMMAIAMGMDPGAASTGALNERAVAANRAAQRAYDPQLRDQRLLQLMGLADDVSNPAWGGMFDDIANLLLSFEGQANQRNAAEAGDDFGFGDAIGTLVGLGSGGFFKNSWW